MIIGSMIILGILGAILLAGGEDIEGLFWTGIISFIMSIIILIFGCFHGFINYPKTEGTHQGVITAVDLEGIYFRRYEVYLKSSAFTEQGDETKYLIYDYEDKLAQELQNAIGKKVKLYYGHDGGYINWKSCGTYHIKKIEIVED